MQSSAGGGPPREPDVFPIASAARPVSDEVRASLAAVRAAREAARMRQRRDTLRIRALTATALATFAAGTVVLAHFRASGRAAAGTSAPASRLTARMPMAPLGADTDAPLPGAPPSPAAGPQMNAESASPSNAARDLLAACTDAVEKRLLRTAAATCAGAFAAQPSDASLAMKVAQVQHARAQYLDAGEWARRAIDLETTDADAYAILAHAEARARHPAAATSAYRQYLALAPRGWHASEARRALRAAKRQARAEGPGGR